MEIYLENLNATITPISVDWEDFNYNKSTLALTASVVLIDNNGQRYSHLAEVKNVEFALQNVVTFVDQLIKQHYGL